MLTGNRRYRVKKSCFGKAVLVLQVEYKYQTYGGHYFTYHLSWRDATVEDITEGNVV